MAGFEVPLELNFPASGFSSNLKLDGFVDFLLLEVIDSLHCDESIILL